MSLSSMEAYVMEVPWHFFYDFWFISLCSVWKFYDRISYLLILLKNIFPWTLERKVWGWFPLIVLIWIFCHYWKTEVCALHRTYILLIYLFKSHFFFLSPEILTQRFTVEFLSLNSTNGEELFENPGINILFCLLKVKKKMYYTDSYQWLYFIFLLPLLSCLIALLMTVSGS